MMQRKLRIVHVLSSGSVGGMQRAVYQLSKYMVRRGDLDVTVAFAFEGGPFQERIRLAGANIWIAHLSSGWDVTKLWKIRRFMGKFDIHHFHSNAPIFMLASCLQRKKFRVYTNRGGLRRISSRRRIRKAIMGFLLRHFFSAFSGNTSAACDASAERHGIPRSKHKVVYNGSDFDYVQPQRQRLEVIRELGLNEDVRIISTSAYLKKGKRTYKMVRLAGKLDENSVVMIVGDGPELKELKQLASKLCVLEKVLFLGMKENPFDYVNAADVFVLPSGPEESFGNSAVEAMALAIPTIVYKDGGGLVEHVIPGETGFVVSDDEELYDTVSRLLCDPVLRMKVGDAGKNHVKVKYGVENMINAYYRLYDPKFNSAEMEESLSNDEE